MSWLGKELTAASATGAEQDPRPQRGKTDQKFIAQESQEVMKHDETNPCLLDRASPEPATEEQVVKRLRCVCHQSAFCLSHLHSDMLPACPRQKANKNSFGFDQRFTAWSSQKLLQRLQSLILWKTLRWRIRWTPPGHRSRDSLRRHHALLLWGHRRPQQLVPQCHHSKVEHVARFASSHQIELYWNYSKKLCGHQHHQLQAFTRYPRYRHHRQGHAWPAESSVQRGARRMKSAAGLLGFKGPESSLPVENTQPESAILCFVQF